MRSIPVWFRWLTCIYISDYLIFLQTRLELKLNHASLFYTPCRISILNFNLGTYVKLKRITWKIEILDVFNPNSYFKMYWELQKCFENRNYVEYFVFLILLRKLKTRMECMVFPNSKWSLKKKISLKIIVLILQYKEKTEWKVISKNLNI